MNYPNENKANIQSDVNLKYSGTHLLLKGEEELKNYNKWIIDKFLRNVRINIQSKVLDFGAGVGTLSQLFFDVTNVKPECVEIDLEQRWLIEERGFKSYPTLNEINKKYDLIFTSNVLEHIEDDIKALSDLKLKLLSSGLLVIFVPAFDVIWSSMDDRVGHCRRYKKVSLISKLENSGYIVRYISYCDSLGFILSFIFKFIGNKNGEPTSASLKMYDRFLLPVSRLMDFLVCGKFGKNILAIATPK
jgi:SAM-dependent methyltransferase